MKNLFLITIALLSASITFGQSVASATLTPITNFEHNEATLSGNIVSSTDSVFYYVECRESGQVNFTTKSDTVLEFTTAGTPQGYSIIAENLTGNTAYECRIATFIGEDSLIETGNFSNIRSFTTLIDPQEPEVLGLEMEAIGLTTAIINIGYICGNILSQYVINGLSAPMTLDLIGQGDTSVLLMGLSPATEYTVEVQGFNSQFFFGNTEEITFTTNTPVGGSASLENIDAELTEVSYDISIITELHDVEVFTHIVNVESGDTATTWNSSSVSSDTILSMVATNLMPATEYRIYLSLEENGTISLQDVATFSTPPCQSPVIQTTATETHASITLAIEVETNDVSPFTSSVTVNISENQTGNVIYDETLTTGLLGDTVLNLSQAGLDPQTTYTVTITVSGICGNTQETINVTTLPEPDPIPGPGMTRDDNISSPNVNTIRIPLTLTGSAGLINVYATAITSTGVILEENTLILSSVNAGLHVVDFGPYDPDLQITLTLVAEYADTASEQTTLVVNTFTQPGGVPSIVGWSESVTQNFGIVKFGVTTGGYAGTVQVSVTPVSSNVPALFTLQGDTLLNLNLGQFAPGTDVQATATLTTVNYGSMSETVRFTTLEEESEDPTSIQDEINNDINLSPHSLTTPVSGRLIVTDILGRVILEKECIVGKNTISVPQLKSGVYIYTFMYIHNRQKGMKTVKFMH